MIERLQQLADMAQGFAPPEAVAMDEYGFSLDVNGDILSFFSPGGEVPACYCRAKVAELGARKCPGAFAEAALNGNFFWRGTEGATLSLNTAENAIYLTDRFDEGAFEDEKAFQAYIDGFVRTLFDWQERLDTYMTGKEVAK